MQETSLETPVTVFDIPEAACRRQIAERLNVSLHFPAADWLVLGDGAGHLHLIATADRTHNDQWLVGIVVLLLLFCLPGSPVWLNTLLLHDANTFLTSQFYVLPFHPMDMHVTWIHF